MTAARDGRTMAPGLERPAAGMADQVRRSAILVVDDIEWNRVLIGGLLAGAGFRNVRFAVDGAEALRSVDADPPDLVVLDIMMPGIDGFEVCRRLRANPQYADMPILVQTALTGMDDRNRAFAAGSTDLICKPLERVELIARIRIHLENRILIRDLRSYHARVTAEMAMARAVYEHLLPGAARIADLEAATGLTIRSQMVEASDAGGDVWNAWVRPDGELAVYLLDMAGRGVGAALNVCRLHTLIQDLDPDAAPEVFLTALNQAVLGLLDTGDYAKVMMGVTDRRARCFRYATAAAPYPAALAPEQPPRFGDAAGLPIGAASETVYQPRVLPFVPGSAILVMSNAVFDLFANESDPRAAVAALLQPAVGLGPDALFSVLADAVGTRPTDDHTAIWVAWPAVTA